MMRLICPKCGAQYEVDDSVIPAMGRDVQCSDCGAAWFQKSAKDVAAEAEARRAAVVAAASKGAAMAWEETADLAGAPEVKPAPVPPPPAPEAKRPEPVAEPEPQPEKAPAPVTKTEPEPEPVKEPEPAPPPPAAAKPSEPAKPETPVPAPEGPVFKRRAIDETTLNVLREEAERESQARRTDDSTAQYRSSVVEPGPERSIQMRGTPEAVPAAPEPDLPILPVEAPEDGLSRKELLPDIEQINSTLRPSSDRSGEDLYRDAPEVLRRKRGFFRLGFVLAAGLIAALALLYALAPMIVSLSPGSEETMASYVASVDGLRHRLEDLVLTAAERMGGPSR